MAWAADPVSEKKLLFIGDSLTEGLGVAKENAFPFLIQEKLKRDQKKWTVINAGISGATSAGLADTLRWHLKSHPDFVVIAIGGNDGLRGLLPSDLEKNLKSAAQLLQKEKIPLLICGMSMPPNYTKDYVKKFSEIYPRVARELKVPLMPFILEGVAGEPSLNQPDGIHPNEKGHAIIADHLYRILKGKI